MILKEISETSIVISLFRYFIRWYTWLGQRINYIYHTSKTHRFVNRFREKIKIYFRYSFLGRITEPRQTTFLVLESSLTLEYLISFYKRWKDKIIQFLKTSSTVDLVKNLKEQLNFSPVRVISIIIVTAIIINVILSMVLQKQIGLWGWLIRGLFLFVGISGLLCKADWPTVKRSCGLLRKMRKD